MNKFELGKHINNFVKLNPKKNKFLKINQELNKSFFVIKNIFKENIKYILTSNYDDIFYYKKLKLSGKKWIEILLSSKDIFEYNKKIRDDFLYCKQRKFIKILLDDLFNCFNKNPQNVVIENSESHFEEQINMQLEKIRYFLDKKDWSNYFFNLQKIMHEQIIKFLSWNKKSFNYEIYNKDLKKSLNDILNPTEVNKYLQFVQKVNLYRNTLCKVQPVINKINQSLFEDWNNCSELNKEIKSWPIN
ncbi:hypothetical protein [Spiroplasma endosymbiont of Lariophagus distinguendus]|uniref:hypothetical protein n=1 Tax=Spiroplasma endosymbiont of Lariophagus distinguendus TaxID=2935082 RepID=UPI00207A07D7|nr:hypothetical protein [Spiroplasma endosymbiont of Lariophagus distinguendus]